MPNNDLISRKALLSGFDVRKVTEYDESGCGVNYKAVPVKAIEAAPAVDAEPVRHGRWEIELDETSDCEFIRCSICSEVFYDGENDTVDTLPNYCPNCGAKMEENE